MPRRKILTEAQRFVTMRGLTQKLFHVGRPLWQPVWPTHAFLVGNTVANPCEITQRFRRRALLRSNCAKLTIPALGVQDLPILYFAPMERLDFTDFLTD